MNHIITVCPTKLCSSIELPISLCSKWRLTASLRRYAPNDAVRLHTSCVLPQRGNAVKLSEICGDSFCDKVSQVAQDSQVSQVPQMR